MKRCAHVRMVSLLALISQNQTCVSVTACAILEHVDIRPVATRLKGCMCMQLALQAGEESGDAPPVVKGTKKKKKKASGKKKMSKEEAIAAAQEAQAAAAAALEKGISHEDAAKAAEAKLNVRALSPLPI